MKLLLWSGAFGFFAWLIGLPVYMGGFIKGGMTSSVGLLFFLLSVFVSFGILLYSHLEQIYEGDILGNVSLPVTVMILLGGNILMLLLAALFQRLYALDPGSAAAVPRERMYDWIMEIGNERLREKAEELGADLTALLPLLQRNLFSARYLTGADMLYALLRVLFITLLGTGVGCLAALAYGRAQAVSLIFVASVTKSLLAALLIEVGTGIYVLPDVLLWLIGWILISVTVAEWDASFVKVRSRVTRS